MIINRVHLSLAAQFAQLQSSTTKFLLMLSGIVESKILLVLVQFVPPFIPRTCFYLHMQFSNCLWCLGSLCLLYYFDYRQSFTMHLLQLMTSWAVVCDVWYLEPQNLKPGETAIEFAER